MSNIFSLGAHKSLLIVIFFMVVSMGWSLRLTPNLHVKLINNLQKEKEAITHKKEESKVEIGMELYSTGSAIPDCSHACGPCSPCKRVMVSFECSIAESCPVVYKCACNGKFYHVPSN